MYTAGVKSYIFPIFGVLDLLPDWVKMRAKSYISSIFGVLDLLPHWVKMRAKSNGWGKKNRTRSCSRFAANLGKKMNENERERGETCTRFVANLGERDRTQSCPHPGPTRPHMTRPTRHGPNAAPLVSMERSTKRESSRPSSF